MPSQDLAISLIQTNLLWEDPEGNRARFTSLLQQIDEPTDLVLLPEMFTTGFSMQPAKFAETLDGPTVDWMAAQASNLDAVICGSIISQGDSGYVNRLFWMAPDGQFQTYDKRHLFGMAGEDKDYTAGNERLIATVKDWRVCPLICYDLRFPVWSRNQDWETGSRPAFDLLTYVANWPDKRIAHWSTLLRGRAIENQVWVAGLNRIGVDDNGFEHMGASAVIDPIGETVFEKRGAEAVQTIQLKADQLKVVREKLPFLQDSDTFSIKR